MYSTCIFCSGPLRANDALETFPVGRRLAFDAWKGRLWAICPRCARWNLAPIEERWEAVEDAEKLFRAARLRVHSENVGLARLADGTDLVRVGEALPGELAAWRYGEQLVRRRRRYLFMGGAAAAVGMGMLGLWAAGAVSFVAAWFVSDMARDIIKKRGDRRAVHLLCGEDSPTGEPLLVQEAHLIRARLELDDHDSLLLHVPRKRRARGSLLVPPVRALPELELRDDLARRLVSRAMVHINEGGGSKDVVRDAVSRLAAVGDPEELVRQTARRGLDLGAALASAPLLAVPGLLKIERGKKEDRRRARWRVHQPPDLLALEMALHEESERRALGGELAVLEAAWREAEEIAAIADALPDDRIVLPDRLRE